MQHFARKVPHGARWSHRKAGAMVAGVSLRKSINVSMSPRAKAFIEGLSSELGLSETQIATRMFEWLEQQDDTLVRGVLGLLPPSMMNDIKRLALKKLKPPAPKKRGR
jgi:hypothetical protein